MASRALETRRVAGVEGSLTGSEGTTAGQALRAVTDLLRLTRPSIASGTERREKTFWEVAADAGSAYGRRQLVGDVAGHRHGRRRADRSRDAPARTRRHTRRGDRAGRALREAAGRLRRPCARAPTMRRRAPSRGRAHKATSRPSFVVPRTWMPSSFVLTAEVSEPATDLVVVYLPGLDIAQHTLLDRRRERTVAVRARLAPRLAQGVLRCARSAPGASDRAERKRARDARDRPRARHGRATGRLVVMGPAARSGSAQQASAHRCRTDGALCAWRPDERAAGGQRRSLRC